MHLSRSLSKPNLVEIHTKLSHAPSLDGARKEKQATRRNHDCGANAKLTQATEMSHWKAQVNVAAVCSWCTCAFSHTIHFDTGHADLLADIIHWAAKGPDGWASRCCRSKLSLIYRSDIPILWTPLVFLQNLNPKDFLARLTHPCEQNCTVAVLHWAILLSGQVWDIKTRPRNSRNDDFLLESSCGNVVQSLKSQHLEEGGFASSRQYLRGSVANEFTK